MKRFSFFFNMIMLFGFMTISSNLEARNCCEENNKQCGKKPVVGFASLVCQEIQATPGSSVPICFPEDGLLLSGISYSADSCTFNIKRPKDKNVYKVSFQVRVSGIDSNFTNPPIIGFEANGQGQATIALNKDGVYQATLEIQGIINGNPISTISFQTGIPRNQPDSYTLEYMYILINRADK